MKAGVFVTACAVPLSNMPSVALADVTTVKCMSTKVYANRNVDESILLRLSADSDANNMMKTTNGAGRSCDAGVDNSESSSSIVIIGEGECTSLCGFNAVTRLLSTGISVFDSLHGIASSSA